jgi:hypothetical protein
MLRLLHLWLDGRPNVQRWWASISDRPSYQSLEEYPGQSKDDEAPHAKAGAAVENKVKGLLESYRQTMPQL